MSSNSYDNDQENTYSTPKSNMSDNNNDPKIQVVSNYDVSESPQPTYVQVQGPPNNQNNNNTQYSIAQSGNRGGQPSYILVCDNGQQKIETIHSGPIWPENRN